jgi:hypothetical protein
VIAPCIGGRAGRGRDGPVRPQQPHQRAPRRRRASDARAFRRCSTLRGPSTLREAKPSGAHQHATPARRDPGGSVACAAPCPRASEGSPVKFGQRCAWWGKLLWRPRDFASSVFGARFRRCGGRVCALDRTKCQAGGWLAFGPRKCGWLRALTPRVCACVLVAVEMPFSSTFSAAAGATKLLRGYKVAQKI